MPKYAQASLKKYSQDLWEKLPAPGGGSAAAFTACLGASLIGMVVNFSLGKPKYARFDKYLKTTFKSSKELKDRFLKFVDDDVAAYKSGDIKRSLAVPLGTARLSFEALMLCPGLIGKSNKNLVSDISVAAILLESALAAAIVNVDINLKSLGDKKLSAALRKELYGKYKRARAARAKIEERVNDVIGR